MSASFSLHGNSESNKDLLKLYEIYMQLLTINFVFEEMIPRL